MDFAAVRPFLRNRLTSVFGHAVGDRPSPFVAYIYRHPSVAEFRGALAFLQANFQFVGLPEVEAHFCDSRPLPDYPLFLSFDDGLRSCLDTIAPILKEMEIPATFFLTADAVDNRYLFYGHRKSYLLTRLSGRGGDQATRESLLACSIHTAAGRQGIDEAAEALGVDWADVLSAERPFLTHGECQTLQEMGFTLGAHGKTHTKFQFLSEAERDRELRDSLDFMQDGFGLDRVAFCFPHSHDGVGLEWMQDTIASEPRLSLFFSTGGFAPNERHMVNRLGFDRTLTAATAAHGFNIERKLAQSFTRAQAKARTREDTVP